MFWILSLALSSTLQTPHINKPCSGLDEWSLALLRAWDRTSEVQSSTSFKPTPSPSPLETERGEKKWDNPPPLCSLHEPVSPESLHSLIKGFLDLNFLLDPYIRPPYLLKNISTRFNLSFKICGLSPILILSLSLQLRKVVEKQLLINPLLSFLSSTASVIFNKADYGIASTNCGRIFNSCTVLWMILKIRRDGDLWSRNLLKIVFSCFPSLQLYTWID